MQVGLRPYSSLFLFFDVPGWQGTDLRMTGLRIGATQRPRRWRSVTPERRKEGRRCMLIPATQSWKDASVKQSFAHTGNSSPFSVLPRTTSTVTSFYCGLFNYCNGPLCSKYRNSYHITVLKQSSHQRCMNMIMNEITHNCFVVKGLP